MSANSYYLARPGDSQRQGPFTLEQLEQGLRDGNFSAGDVVWQSGTPDWVPITTVVAPPVPQGPPIPPAPPQGAPPPPPPPPPPPGYQGGYAPPPAPPGARPPWSPLGLIGLLVVAGAGGFLFWALSELWDKYPAIRPPKLYEATIAWITAGFGAVALALALPHLFMKRVRGKTWAIITTVLGSILAVAGVVGGVSPNLWNHLRYEEEEDGAVADMLSLTSAIIEHAEVNKGQFPKSMEELKRTASNQTKSNISYFERGRESLSAPVFKPAIIMSNPRTEVVRDPWISGRGKVAVYYSDGSTRSEYASTLDALAGQAASYDLLPGGGPDLSTPEKAFQALVAAAKQGDLEGVRKCATVRGFQKDFARATPDKLRREFGGVQLTIGNVTAPTLQLNGNQQAKVTVQIREGTENHQEVLTFEKQGQNWLLDSM